MSTEVDDPVVQGCPRGAVLVVDAAPPTPSHQERLFGGVEGLADKRLVTLPSGRKKYQQLCKQRLVKARSVHTLMRQCWAQKYERNEASDDSIPGRRRGRKTCRRPC